MDDREKEEAENKEKQRKAKIALGNCIYNSNIK